MKPVKVGFLTGRLLLGYGVDLVVHQYASLLRARGYHSLVYCLENDQSVTRSYDVVSLRELFGVDELSPVNIPRYAAHLNSLDIDIWIANTPPFYDFIPFMVRPVIAIEYGSPPSRYFPPDIGRLIDTAVEYRLHRVYRRLRREDRIVCISRSMQDWLPDDVKSSSEVVYLGCDHYGKADAGAAADFRRASGLTAGPVVLWVGRVQIVDDIQPYKGFKAFIEMVRLVRQADPSIQFLVIGKGGDAEAEFLSRQGIAHRLNLPDAEMGAAYAASDLFVSTSRWEGFNLPLLEAQHQGTPALALALGPHPEVVQDGRTGVLVEDPADMPAVLLDLMRDGERRARLSDATEGFAGQFSWETSVTKLQDVIVGSLDAAGSKPDRTTGLLNRTTFPVEYYYQRFGLGTLLKRLPTYPLRRLRRFLRRGNPT